MRFRIYRFDPGRQRKPFLQDYEVRLEPSDRKVLDALERLRAQDDSLAYRRSCREGVCGSDAMNINGRNMLACITPLEGLAEPVTLALPGVRLDRALSPQTTFRATFESRFVPRQPTLTTGTRPETVRVLGATLTWRIGW